jgi:hypothetical protein
VKIPRFAREAKRTVTSLIAIGVEIFTPVGVISSCVPLMTAPNAPFPRNFPMVSFE